MNVTVPRDFLISGFFRESVSPQPWDISLGPFRIFSKIRRDIRIERWQMEKIFKEKVLNILLRHLWVVELT
jgi:hypothetical protein